MSFIGQIGGKRGGKSKAPLPASSSLFALGTNTNVTTSSSTSAASAASKIGIKREATLREQSIPSKRGKIFQGRFQAGKDWEENVLEVDANLLFRKVIEAHNGNNENKIIGYLCGAAKQLKNNRSKPESALYLSLMYLVKIKPQLFFNDLVVEAFCSLLRRENASSTLKTKGPVMVPILAANLLLAAYHDEASWPISFIKVYIDDALGDRLWVDNEACKGFVDNITTAFNTKMIPKNLMSQDTLSTIPVKGSAESPVSSSPIHTQPTEDSLDDASSSSLFNIEMKEKIGEEITIAPRYVNNQEAVHEYVTEVVNEHLNRRQVPSEINRNVLKLLISTVGIQQIRLQGAQRLEIWLQNPKLTRPAQDLLFAIIINCSEDDGEVVSSLVKMRLKTKVLINHFILCIKELLNQNEENIMVVMRNAISNELSSSRGSNNMQLISVIFQFSPAKATKSLALLIQEFLVKDDCLRSIRTLMREITRTLKHDHINLTLLVSTLTEENSKFLNIDSNDTLSRVFTSITDIITLCIFLSISPFVKEACSSSKQERKEILKQYQAQIAEIQRLSIFWFQKWVMKVFRPERNEFIHCLNKCLFMEAAEHYYNKDNWPPETDRNFMFRVSTEVPVYEESLILLLEMGLSKDHHVQPPEAIELSDALIKRAAALFDGDLSSPTLIVQREDIFNLLLKSASYRIPDNISLPLGYDAPFMAISDWYWKVWIQMLIITAHNTSKFKSLGWDSYPTLGLLIEMSITNQFDYPPPTSSKEDLKNRELQIAAIEKQQILQFESHLAAASSKRQITESNSLLLSKLTTFDPFGAPRQPPAAVLDQLKSLNEPLRLGCLLCQSRNPDFLLDIIQRQQTQTLSFQSVTGCGLSSMQWLNDLIEMNCDNLSTLPVQCLGEYTIRFINDEDNLLLNSLSMKQSEKNRFKEKHKKFIKLLAHFKSLFFSNLEKSSSKQLIEYFMQRLISQQSSFRVLASKALSLVLSFENDTDSDNSELNLKYYSVEEWLLNRLPTIANFETIKPVACSCLRSAILVESDPKAICCYIQFLSKFCPEDDRETILDVSLLIIERTIIFTYITKDDNLRDAFLSSSLHLFHNYMNSIKKFSGIHPNCNYQDHFLIKWPISKENAIVPLMVIHALIFLLTFKSPSDSVESYNYLLNLWFCDPPPTSLSAATNEEATLIPNWLKLKLIKSSSPILIDAGLKNLEINQLLLFIKYFGIPVHSMNKLLSALDLACERDEEAVRSSIADLNYIQQVLEVQFMRGVKSGSKFAQLVGVNPLIKDKKDTFDNILNAQL